VPSLSAVVMYQLWHEAESTVATLPTHHRHKFRRRLPAFTLQARVCSLAHEDSLEM
jgi:hypothetical protein